MMNKNTIGRFFTPPFSRDKKSDFLPLNFLNLISVTSRRRRLGKNSANGFFATVTYDQCDQIGQIFAS